MNIIQWLKSQAGNISASVVQIAGAGAVVAVAGFGEYNYLNNTSTEESNAFLPPSSYNEDVVYVAGVSGGSYGSNGELQSSFQAAPSRAIELTQRQEAMAKRNAALRESGSYYNTTQEITSGGNGEGEGLGTA